MSINIENYLPVVKYNGLNTAKNISISGAANFDASGSTGIFSTSTGANTFGGATTFNSTVAFTSAPTGPISTPVTNSATVGATVVLTAAQSGQVFKNVSTSGTPSWTLPTAANGLKFTFICGNTTAGFTVTGGTIHAKTSATGTAVSGTTLTNTQATAVVGDAITIVCDGTAWWMTSQSGIFTAA